MQPFRGVVDPCITAVSSAVKSLTIRCIKRANSLKLSRPTFVKVALKWLKENDFTCEVSDKDGTFVMVDG